MRVKFILANEQKGDCMKMLLISNENCTGCAADGTVLYVGALREGKEEVKMARKVTPWKTSSRSEQDPNVPEVSPFSPVVETRHFSASSSSSWEKNLRVSSLLVPFLVSLLKLHNIVLLICLKRI